MCVRRSRGGIVKCREFSTFENHQKRLPGKHEKLRFFKAIVAVFRGRVDGS